MYSFTVHSKQHTQFINIDNEAQKIVTQSGIQHGLCHIFIPHTTAGITINENADPDVARDIIDTLERTVPWKGSYAHVEGNSAAHVKASMMGFCQTVFIENSTLSLGTWQSIYFCEFDGPRTRKVWVQIIPEIPHV
jgi:secondary thiamine-phosphate synthase enzyme